MKVPTMIATTWNQAEWPARASRDVIELASMAVDEGFLASYPAGHGSRKPAGLITCTSLRVRSVNPSIGQIALPVSILGFAQERGNRE
jgi:hypothetical protein